MLRRLSFLVLFMFCSSAFSQDTSTKKAPASRKPSPALAPIEDEPGLPRVLLIGDSISIGYTLPTRELLKGKANLHRIGTNGGPTVTGMKEIEKWLGDKKWDVIHFNWGLHDLKFVDDKGDLVEPSLGKAQVTLEEYEKNLRFLTQRMKKTGAKLIWCTTTPVPAKSNGRVEGDEAKYNAVAAKIMSGEGVSTNDLCAFAKPQMETIGLPANVHYSPDGYKVLASKVAAAIEVALGK